MALTIPNDVKSKSSWHSDVIFEVLTAVTMGSTVFSDVPSCSPVEIRRCFRGTHNFHPHGRRESEGGSQQEAGDKIVSALTSENEEATCCSETWMKFFWTIRRFIPEDSALNNGPLKFRCASLLAEL
jgi:hypothetical protein